MLWNVLRTLGARGYLLSLLTPFIDEALCLPYLHILHMSDPPPSTLPSSSAVLPSFTLALIWTCLH